MSDQFRLSDEKSGLLNVQQRPLLHSPPTRQLIGVRLGVTTRDVVPIGMGWG